MALNTKTLITRSLSGLVFVVILLGCIFWNYLSFTLLFFVLSLMGLSEFYKISVQLGTKPYKTIGYLSSIFLYIFFVKISLFGIKIDTEIFADFKSVLFLIPLSVFSVALFSKEVKPIQNSIFTLAGILYVTLPFALIHEIVVKVDDVGLTQYNYEILLGVIFLIWSNDTFAYLGGSLFGKKKMIERISPGKTWEGTLFGIAVTFMISFVVKSYFKQEFTIFWPLMGLLVPVLATLGDLIESMLKRQANIKDSGNIMPGHV